MKILGRFDDDFLNIWISYKKTLKKLRETQRKYWENSEKF